MVVEGNPEENGEVMICSPDDLEMFFDIHDGEHGRFDLIEEKLSDRKDIHAFLLLDKIIPGKKVGSMIVSAEHDEIWLDVDLEELIEVATEDQIIELMRCGVRYDSDSQNLAMFV
jgi:hypothetical protein